MGSGSAFPFKQRGYNPPLQEVSEASRSSPGEAPKSVTSGSALPPNRAQPGQRSLTPGERKGDFTWRAPRAELLAIRNSPAPNIFRAVHTYPVCFRKTESKLLG